MRSIYKMYINLKKDYYLFRASECLATAGEYLGTDEFNVWMEQYNKYMNKVIDSIERVKGSALTALGLILLYFVNSK